MKTSSPNFPTCHSHPQSLDSASTPEAFLARELELGTGTLTVTDHGTLVACRKVYDLCHDKKATQGTAVTPILGLEGYLRDDDCPILAAAGIAKTVYEAGTKEAALYPTGTYKDYIKYHHVTIHFLDQAAYETGVRLLSKADERSEQHGSERKPLFTWRDLEELGAQNTTMTTGCLIGVVQRHMLAHNDLGLARAYYQKLRGLVKPGNFFVEVFPHVCDRNWVAGVFLTMADGTVRRYHAEKVLHTNVTRATKNGKTGISAKNLALAFHKPGNAHHTLLAVCNYRVWEELEPLGLVAVEHKGLFEKNECRPWALDGDVQKGLNRVMMSLAAQYGDKILIGDDSHFARPEEKIVQDVRLAQNGGAWRFAGSYHRQSSAEAYEHFKSTLSVPEAQFDSWVDNSLEWAQRFKGFTFETSVSMPTKFYEARYCEHAWHNKPQIAPADHSLMYTRELIEKQGRMDWSNPIYVARLTAEINLLHRNGTLDLLPYFFIGEEVCALYETNHQLTGPGRGSAAGLLLAYLLGITHIDPLRYDLSMDRFLTLDRIRSGKLPDIDQDLPSRDLLCDPSTGWLQHRFGDHVAQLSVDTTLKLRSAVKDTARHLHGSVPPDVEKWTQKFTMPPMGLTDSDFVLGYDNEEGHIKGTSEPNHSGTDHALCDYIKHYPNDWEVVQKCLGLARQKSRHPCAFVIANRPIHEFIPLTTVGEVRVTSYTAASVEAVGGLKMDFLVINSLNDLGQAINLIQKRSSLSIPEHESFAGRRVPQHRLVPHGGKLVDIWDLPEDPKVFADIACGRTETVFQFNTPSAVQWLGHFSKPRANGTYPIDSLLAMAAFTALDRPGPLDIMVINPDGDGRQRHNMLVEYARRSRGETGSTEVLPIFDKLLPETFGVMVYQEQLQRLYQNLTGCTGAEAEEFRTNVAKKRKEKVDAAYPSFIAHASLKIGEANAKAAWAFFKTWAQYGFNKSHAVCYAAIGYACAFLKHHYELEWWASVLTNAAKNEVNEKFWRHCGHLIDLPDIMKSGDGFEIQNNRIRASLSLLHGIGATAHEQLIRYRPYTDLADFIRKQELHPGRSALTKAMIYTLIISGTMDSLLPQTTTDAVGQTRVLSTTDHLQLYETVLADIKTELRPPLKSERPRKPVKVEPVEAKYLTITALARFQMRKVVLPAYGADLLQVLIEMQDRRVMTKDKVSTYRYSPPIGRSLSVPLLTCAQLELRQGIDLGPGQAKSYVAVVAFVEEAKTFTYTRNDVVKTACKFQLDVEGERFEFVRWPDKSGDIPPVFSSDLTGAIVIACLSKFASDRPYAVEHIEIVHQALDHRDTNASVTEEREVA